MKDLSPLDELSDISGIIPEYYDIWGEKRILTPGTKKVVLDAMGFKVSTIGEIKKELRKRKTPSFAERVIVISRMKQPAEFTLNILYKNRPVKIRWKVDDEYGNVEEYEEEITPKDVFEVEGSKYSKITLSDKKTRAIGYYDIEFDCGGIKGRTRLIVAPEACHIAPGFGRVWGVTLNLYAIRSKENWGIGDFGDLLRIIDWVSGLGGSFVGINPLHAIPNSLPSGISPYGAVSRLYRNFIYIDMKKVHGIAVGKYISEIEALRKTEFIDYEGAASLKMKALRESFASFKEKKESPEYAGFMEYVKKEGSQLEDFAAYWALSGIHGTDWRLWPTELREPHGEAVGTFRQGHKDKILFYEYIQWLLDSQLSGAESRAKGNGMKIGLYHDLAIGATAGGADAWSMATAFARSADVGAPPDDFSPGGQKWGVPPLIPERLRELRYEIFIKTIRKNFEHGGLIRIDHALGLFRLFWVTEGLKPVDGAYVKYPAEDFLRIIALESERAGTMVVAEDLGTIGPEVRDSLRRFDMLSYRLFYFERYYPKPEFIRPEHYPRLAFAAVTTHDLPTIYGWWLGRDMEVRKGLSIYADEDAFKRDVENRERDKKIVLSTLGEHGLLPEDFPSSPDALPYMTPQLCLAIYNYLARTPSMLVGASLDDMLGAIEQQNLPGTIDEYPNWRRKTIKDLDEIVEMGKEFGEMFGREGR
jgi:4-alpha-glucanotransferase